jgi:hypoxanthine phosphoribosyltransferase
MNLHGDVERILFNESEIEVAIDRAASEITEHYEGTEFTVVAVLKGSCVFVSDLIRRIPIPLELSFLGVSSYGGGTESGDLRITFLPPGGEIEGRNLLVVDDILDTGRTLSRVRAELEMRGAREVRTCVFLDKPSRRIVPIVPDVRCFEIEDIFVVGYGLDFAGRYRNLPYVAALRAEVLARRPRLDPTPG